MAAPRRSTSSTRSTASARRPWTPSAPGSSHRRDMASLVKHGGIAWRFAVLGGAGAGLVVARPGDRGAAPGAWLALLALAAAASGLGVGALRLAAIDRGAFRG